MVKILKVTLSLILLYFLLENLTTQCISNTLVNDFWKKCFTLKTRVLVLIPVGSLGAVCWALTPWPLQTPLPWVVSHHCQFKSCPSLKAQFKCYFLKLSLVYFLFISLKRAIIHRHYFLSSWSVHSLRARVVSVVLSIVFVLQNAQHRACPQ